MNYCTGYFEKLRNNVSIVLVFLLTITINNSFGEKIIVNPAETPVSKLSAAETNQLKALLGASTVDIVSTISPDDKSVLVSVPEKKQLFFKDLRADTILSVDQKIFNYTLVTDFKWRDYRNITTIGKNAGGQHFILTIDKFSGTFYEEPLTVTGKILSLSTKASRILVARTLQAQSTDTPDIPRDEDLIIMQPLYPGYNRDDAQKYVPVAVQQLQLVAIDLYGLQERKLIQIPENEAILSMAWSSTDSRIAIVHGRIAAWARNVFTEQSPEVQDGLGILPPKNNPLYTSNAIELFCLLQDEPTHIKISPDDTDKEIFYNVCWAPNTKMIMTQTDEPSIIQGRQYPSFGNVNGANFKFYTSSGTFVHKLKKPEVDAQIVTSMQFISYAEVIITTIDKLSSRIFYYNFYSKQLRSLPTPEGFIRKVVAKKYSTEFIYTLNSITQPEEVFSSTFRKESTKQLTRVNAAAFDANKVRIDKVEFQLAKGETRIGYLIQPKNALFPPNNVPLCVWHEGGPITYMLNRWYGTTEGAHNILPNFGIATIMVPLPGRIGFGKKFINDLVENSNFGQIDMNEQQEISQQLINRGYTSKDRIGIYGMSYGGYFTSQTITMFPDMYAAANNQFSLLDLKNEWETGYMWYLGYLMGCTPSTNNDEFLKDSPLQHAHKVRTPTLVYTSSNDFLPSKFSEEFHDKINATGLTKSDVYYFLNDGHGLYQPNNQFVATQNQILWFRKYLVH